MTRYYIGIDPGINGAIGVLNEKGEFVASYDMPATKSEINKYLLIDILENYRLEPHFLVIEKCQYTPKIKGKGAYTFGKAVMACEMALAALRMRHMIVPPQTWKKKFNLIKKTKADSIMLAKQMYPSQIDNFKKSKDGRAEALFLAEYGRLHELS